MSSNPCEMDQVRESAQRLVERTTSAQALPVLVAERAVIEKVARTIETAA